MDQDNTIAVQALDSAKSAHHRLDRLEDEVKDIHDLAAAMAATRQEITGVQADIREIKQSVSKLTARPEPGGTSWLRRRSARQQQES